MEEIIEMYKGGVSAKEIGSIIGYSDSWVRLKLKENGVVLTQKSKRMSEEDMNGIKGEFLAGVGIKSLHLKYGFSMNSINLMLKREGVYENRNLKKSWSEDEVFLAKDLSNAGFSIVDISKKMGYTEKTTSRLLHEHKIRSKRAPYTKIDAKMIDKMVELKESGFNTVEIGEKLGVSDTTVGRRLISLGYDNTGSSLTDHELFIIEKAYTEGGMTNQEIWEEYFSDRCCMKTIERATNELGVSRAGGNYNWDLIRDYFKEINTPEKAYVLGYLSADGHVTGKVIRLECTYKDREIIDFIVDQICPTAKVSKCDREGKNSTAVCYLGSADMVRDLEKYNIFPVKQCMDYPLPKLPHELYRDFIRGYFDGDGTCWIVDGRYPRISICLDEHPAKQMELMLGDAGVITKSGGNIVDMRKYGINIFHLRITRKKDVESFYNYIYYSDDVFRLERKYQKIHTHIRSNVNTEVINSLKKD